MSNCNNGLKIIGNNVKQRMESNEYCDKSVVSTNLPKCRGFSVTGNFENIFISFYLTEHLRYRREKLFNMFRKNTSRKYLLFIHLVLGL